MKSFSPRLVLATAAISVAGFCADPAAAQAAPAAARNEWREYIRPYAYSDLPKDYEGKRIPPGPELSPEAVKELPAADLSTSWKLRDGSKLEFKFAGYDFPSAGQQKDLRFHLRIQGKPGDMNPRYFLVSRLHPDEYPRVQRLVWHRHYENKKLVVQRPEPAPAKAVERTVFHFPGSGLKTLERRGYANRPPGPEVAEAVVSGLPLWPAMQKWKLKGGREVEFSLFGWHWRASTEPVVDLEVLPAGTAACSTLPALDLDPSETDRLLQNLWRRHYHVRKVLAFPFPNPLPNPYHTFDSVSDLTRAIPFGAMLPVPSLALPGCQLMPPPAPLPDRMNIPDLDAAKFPGPDRDSLPISIASYLLWWDDTAWLPLEQKGDLDKKAAWLHGHLAKELRTRNNALTNWGAAPEGLRDLSVKHLGGKYDFQMFADYDYRPANQARLAAGMNGVILGVYLYRGAREGGWHTMPLISAAPDGNATVTSWGQRLRGKWQECDQPQKDSSRGDKRVLLPVYEFIVENRDSLPKSFIQNNTRIILGSRTWDALYVLVPQRCFAPQKKPVKK